MNTAEFERNLKRKQEALRRYYYNVFPNSTGRIVLRFINGNFRAQGWQGAQFAKWKSNGRKNGTILIKTGRGRRGTQFTTSPGSVRIYNSVGYMAVHNRGFNGTVQVPAHVRRLYGKRKVGTGRYTKTGKERTKSVSFVRQMTSVKSHTKRMNIPKRQFMPNSLTDSPALHKALKREVERELKQIFK